MSGKRAVAALAFAGLIGSAVPSFAMSGLGCPDLPLYYRALGQVINGGSACGLSNEEARAILAREKGPSDATLSSGPVGHRAYRRHAE